MRHRNGKTIPFWKGVSPARRPRHRPSSSASTSTKSTVWERESTIITSRYCSEAYIESRWRMVNIEIWLRKNTILKRQEDNNSLSRICKTDHQVHIDGVKNSTIKLQPCKPIGSVNCDMLQFQVRSWHLRTGLTISECMQRNFLGACGALRIDKWVYRQLSQPPFRHRNMEMEA